MKDIFGEPPANAIKAQGQEKRQKGDITEESLSIKFFNKVYYTKQHDSDFFFEAEFRAVEDTFLLESQRRLFAKHIQTVLGPASSKPIVKDSVFSNLKTMFLAFLEQCMVNKDIESLIICISSCQHVEEEKTGRTLSEYFYAVAALKSEQLWIDSLQCLGQVFYFD